MKKTFTNTSSGFSSILKTFKKAGLMLGLITAALAGAGVLTVHGQAPNISYATPQIYTVGTAITPLVPVQGMGGGAVPATVYRQTTTLAGSTQGFADKPIGATTSQFDHPRGVVVDASGNVYVADSFNHRIRKISTIVVLGVPTLVVSTLAGNANPGSTDATGSAAGFNNPSGVAVDASGNVYVADTGNGKIRKITSGGEVTTVASGFNNPLGVAVDGSGNVYVADTDNHTIKKVVSGTTSTLAGSTQGFNDAAGTNAKFDKPTGIAVDASGNVYVADAGNNKIRKIDTGGGVSTLVSNLSNPCGVEIDNLGNLYVANRNSSQILKITPSLAVIYLAGSTPGFNDAIGADAQFDNPSDVAIDASGNVYVSDLLNHKIRKVVTTGYTISTALPAGLNFNAATGEISGTPTALSAVTAYDITAHNVSGSSLATVKITVKPLPPNISYATPQTYTVGTAITALVPGNTGSAIPATTYGQTTTLGSPLSGNVRGVVFDGLTGNTYAIVSGAVIMKIDQQGAASVFATGFNVIRHLAVDALGNVYTADAGTHKIMMITKEGTVSDFAGSGAQGSADNNMNKLNATFNQPTGVAVDAQGNVYVTETIGRRVRKIANNSVSTLAGNGQTVSSLASMNNINGLLANFSILQGITVDAEGNVYVADAGVNAIRKISSEGTNAVTTLAGGSIAGGTIDATGVSARFNTPEGIAIDAGGYIYVADKANHKIRKISPNGVVSTIAGDLTNKELGYIDAVGTSARFNTPYGIAVDGSGNLYVGEDINNKTVRKIVATGYAISPVLPVGLNFNVMTGEISGTPNAVSSATDYTIAASNTGGSSLATLNLTINPNVVASDNANLQSLIVTGATLDQTFATGTLTYTATVPHDTESITLTPTPEDQTGAKVTVNQDLVGSGIESGSISLTSGANIITILVLAENGSTSKTYTLTVTRLPSANAELSDFVINGGMPFNEGLFDPAKINYTANVSHKTTFVKVRPYRTDLSSVIAITVNNMSIPFDSNLSISNSIDLVEDGITDINILITAEDGTTTKTYTLSVTREPLSEIIYVRKGAVGDFSGDSWYNAATELSNALEIAKNNALIKQIWVAAGTYKPTINYAGTMDNRDNTFLLIDGVKLYGGFLGGESSLSARNISTNPTILSGDIDNTPLDNAGNAYHVLVAAGAGTATVLDGFIVENGNANGAGSSTISGLAFARNNGGAMYLRSSGPLLYNTVFRTNHAQNHGGGMYSLDSSPQIINTVFIKNTSAFGGAIRNDNSTINIINSTLSDNSSTNAISGGAVYSSNTSGLTISNSILYNNTANNSINNFNTAGQAPVTVTYSLVQGGQVGTGNINADPLFVNEADGDLRLTACSPAINKGSDAAIAGIAKDLDGNTRVFETVDMGAYELQSAPSPLVLSPATLVSPSVNKAYTSTFTLNSGCNTGTISFAITAGSIPDEFNFDPNTGILSGTPTISATYNFSITATQNSKTVTNALTLKVLSDNANLGNITLSTGSLSGTVQSGILEYTAIVDNFTNSLTITPNPVNIGASITVNGGSISSTVMLNAGTATPTIIPIVVTSEDGSVTKTYTLTVIKQVLAISSNADLSDLTVIGGTALSPDFAINTQSYSTTVTNNSNSNIGIYLTPVNPEAKLKITDANGMLVTTTMDGNTFYADIPTNVGSSTITIEVTSKDGSASKTYTITATRTASSNTYLSNLAIEDVSLDPAVFDPDLSTYLASVTSETSSIIVSPTKAFPGASVTVNGNPPSNPVNLTAGLTTDITIVVTAEDGVSTRTYLLKVTRPLSNNANLSALAVSKDNVPLSLNENFSENVLVYTASVVDAVSSILVSPTVGQVSATVTVNDNPASELVGLNTGSNTITILVTAQDGTTTKTYTLLVTRLTVGAATQTIAFTAPAAKTYGDASFMVGPELSTVSTGGALTVTYSAEDPSIVTFNGNIATIVGAGTTTITARQLGNVNVNAAPEVMQTLTVLPKAITITATAGQSKVYGAADPVFAYTLTSGSLVGQDIFSGLLSRASGENAGDYAINLGTLKAGNVLVNNYDITFVGANFTISKAPLTITAANKTKVQGEANPVLTATYNGFVGSDDNNALSAQPVIGTTATAASAVGTYTITVSGATSSNYAITHVDGTLTVTPSAVLSSDANLSGLTLSAGTLSPTFAPGTIAYTASVSNATSSIILTPTAFAGATIKVSGTTVVSGTPSAALPLIPGNNIISIVVTAQDGTVKTYTLTVNKAIAENPAVAVKGTNIMSPNGDGVNDYLVFEGIDQYPDNELIVADMTGRAVYKKRTYNNNWDGTIDGTPLLEGTYYWVINFGSGKVKTGFVTILRN